MKCVTAGAAEGVDWILVSALVLAVEINASQRSLPFSEMAAGVGALPLAQMTLQPAAPALVL